MKINNREVIATTGYQPYTSIWTQTTAHWPSNVTWVNASYWCQECQRWLDNEICPECGLRHHKCYFRCYCHCHCHPHRRYVWNNHHHNQHREFDWRPVEIEE